MREYNNNKKNAAEQKKTKGISEFAVALGLVVLILGFFAVARYYGLGFANNGSVKNGILEDNTFPEADAPTQTILDPISADDNLFPFQITENLTLDRIYTATGYFPENGTDEAIENVLAVKVTNTSEKTLEYLSFTLLADGEDYKFAAATLPSGKSVYVFNTEKKTAPDAVATLESEVEFEIYFTEEPSKESNALSYKIQNGAVVVTNVSDADIKTDIVVYYKSTAENDYLGGITYRFRIEGGITAGQSYIAYAPHAYAHMTEIMFTQYEK